MSDSCDPRDCRLPGSEYGILQERVLEWVAISFSKDLPDPGTEPTHSVSHTLQADSLLTQL